MDAVDYLDVIFQQCISGEDNLFHLNGILQLKRLGYFKEFKIVFLREESQYSLRHKMMERRFGYYEIQREFREYIKSNAKCPPAFSYAKILETYKAVLPGNSENFIAEQLQQWQEGTEIFEYLMESYIQKLEYTNLAHRGQKFFIQVYSNKYRESWLPVPPRLLTESFVKINTIELWEDLPENL